MGLNEDCWERVRRRVELKRQEDKDVSGLKAERCRVRRSTRSFRIGEIRFMLPRWSGVGSEVGFPRR